VQAILEEFDEYLGLQCGRSAHTRRAYLGDLRCSVFWTDAESAWTD
jgi:integrase/recombinase XerC